MLAALGGLRDVELFWISFALIKIGLIALIYFVVIRKFPALVRGFRRGIPDLKKALDDGRNS